jgi:hypothetical protein
MSDLNHYVGNDLAVSTTGDIDVASGTLEGQQRVLRRLTTNPSDYIWHPTYGAGVPAEVGGDGDAARITGVIRAQIFNESVVSQSPDPVITVTAIDDGVSAQVLYTDAATGQPASLSFDISR